MIETSQSHSGVVKTLQSQSGEAAFLVSQATGGACQSSASESWQRDRHRVCFALLPWDPRTHSSDCLAYVSHLHIPCPRKPSSPLPLFPPLLSSIMMATYQMSKQPALWLPLLSLFGRRHTVACTATSTTAILLIADVWILTCTSCGRLQVKHMSHLLSAQGVLTSEMSSCMRQASDSR